MQICCSYTYIFFMHPVALAETAKGSFGVQVKLPSLYHTRWRFHTVPFNAERQAGKLWIPIFLVFGLTQLEIKPRSIISVADAPSVWPLIGFSNVKNSKIINLWITLFVSVHSAFNFSLNYMLMKKELLYYGNQTNWKPSKYDDLVWLKVNSLE